MTTTLFIDASAIVAMTTDETDGEVLVRRMSDNAPLICSPILLWEAGVAIARKRNISFSEASASLDEFVASFDVQVRSIGLGEAKAAIQAWARYGKGSRHPAKLNMGDCFAYACARTNDARLLYKGDDFARTDLA